MERHRKRWLLFILGVGVVALLLLSAGLSELEFLPGQPFPLGYVPGGVGGTSGQMAEIYGIVSRVLIIIAALLLPVSIIYFFTSREARKRVLLNFLRLLVALVSVYVLAQLIRLNTFAPEQGLPQAFPDVAGESSVVDVDAAPPPWFLAAVSVGFALLVAAALVGIGWLVWHRRRRTMHPLRQLVQQAEEAIEAIQAGADLRNTVMRCYYEMSRVLRQQRGIRRDQAMTPREFAAFLEETGLPTGAVERLTELFEQVRYGAKVPGREEEAQALACLETIVAFCRSAG